jgi:serine/threonine protein kinase
MTPGVQACPQCRRPLVPVFDPDKRRLVAWYPADLGRYCVLGVAGRGGMGRVFRGQDKVGGKAVAIKFPLQDDDEQGPDRFRREVQVLRSLEHPNIVRYLDDGEEANYRYYVMEWVEGETLAKKLAHGRVQGEVLPFATFHGWFRQVCAGLQALHDRGIVHRDVKPSNIMVRPDGVVKLLDLGVAKQQLGSDDTTRSSAAVGTLKYLAPEQQQPGEVVDQRADVFALGVVAYESLTGALPWGNVRKPSAVNRTVPRWFDALVLQMLESDLTARPLQIGPLGDPPASLAARLWPATKPWLVVLIFVLVIPGFIAGTCYLGGQRWLTGLGGPVSAILFLILYRDHLRSRGQVLGYWWAWTLAYAAGSGLVAYFGLLWLWCVCGGMAALAAFFIVDIAVGPRKVTVRDEVAPTPAGAMPHQGEIAVQALEWSQNESGWDRSGTRAWLFGVPLMAVLSGLFFSCKTSIDYRWSGDEWLARKDYDRAIIDYGEAIHLNPKDAVAYCSRGIAWRNKSDPDRAIKDFDEVVRLAPEEGTGYCLRAFAWAAKGDRERARRDYEEALRRDPENTARLGSQTSAIYLTSGDVDYFLGKYDDALQAYDFAIIFDMRDASGFNNRGNAWLKKKEYDIAIRDYDEAIRLDPKGAAFFNRGLAWAEKNEYDKAIKDYDEVIRLDPKGAAFFNRGLAWSKKNEYDKAIKDYDEAIRLDPKDATAFRNRGLTWALKGNYEQATKDIARAVELRPGDAKLRELQELIVQERNKTK